MRKTMTIFMLLGVLLILTAPYVLPDNVFAADKLAEAIAKAQTGTEKA